MIPWVLSDTNYVRGPHQRLDTSWTVFVGGLHGMLNAGDNIDYTLATLYLSCLKRRFIFQSMNDSNYTSILFEGETSLF